MDYREKGHFMKNQSSYGGEGWGDDLFHAEGQIHIHDEANNFFCNSRFSQFGEKRRLIAKSGNYKKKL